jgi:FAD binding domain
LTDADVCVVDGGPVGLVLGLLFARQARSVVVLEKHADFLRDFRGEFYGFRLSRRRSDGESLDMRVGPGRLLLGIDRGDYWQVAYVIPKVTTSRWWRRASRPLAP